MHPMQALAFHRRMTLLALVAIGLLLAAPVTSRLVAAGEGAQGVWTQLCTAAGLKLVKVSAADTPLWDAAKPDQKAPSGGMQDGDCPYCPLLTGLAMLLAWIIVAGPSGVRDHFAARRSQVASLFRHPSGLGSRGPPLAV